MAIIGFAQYLDPEDPYSDGRLAGNEIDLYIPVFTIVSFIVLVGWLKVAQKMLDPYADGEDDVRFDLHWVLHRNVEVSTAMVIHGHGFHPPMEMTNPLTGSLSTRSNLTLKSHATKRANEDLATPRMSRMSRRSSELLRRRSNDNTRRGNNAEDSENMWFEG
tara:strand:- start:580 stop:1065 length:486 start_codon:yes stop_codon:yes gene_type:complete